MSWYYSYYICRKDTEDGKLYPFGPFDYKGNYYDVLCKSRSSASNLYERFYDIRSTEERHMISKELLKAIHSGLSDEDYTEFYEGRREFFWSYLQYNEMPKGEYLKKGYCLMVAGPGGGRRSYCLAGVRPVFKHGKLWRWMVVMSAQQYEGA